MEIILSKAEITAKLIDLCEVTISYFTENKQLDEIDQMFAEQQSFLFYMLKQMFDEQKTE